MAPIATSIIPRIAQIRTWCWSPVTPGSGGAAASPAAGFGGGVPFDSLCRFEDLSCLPRR